jgi:hypothetical protein
MTAYISVSDLREYLPQAKTGIAADTEMTKVIDRAHQIVTDALSFEFAAWPEAASTQDVLSRGGVWLWIPYHQSDSVETVQLISSRGASSESLDDVDDWIEEDAWRLYANAGWYAGAWYRVTAIWGYGPVPESVIEVEMEAAVNIWRGRDAAVWQNDVGGAGQGAAPFNRALSWSQRDVLNAVRATYLGVVHA